jgi:hypothetical protein
MLVLFLVATALLRGDLMVLGILAIGAAVVWALPRFCGGGEL